MDLQISGCFGGHADNAFACAVRTWKTGNMCFLFNSCVVWSWLCLKSTGKLDFSRCSPLKSGHDSTCTVVLRQSLAPCLWRLREYKRNWVFILYNGLVWTADTTPGRAALALEIWISFPVSSHLAILVLLSRCRLSSTPKIGFLWEMTS